jgi:hypothetical protein
MHTLRNYSQKSESELLGLTEAKVDPKVAPRAELSDVPSLAEVKCVITKLGRRTAPGSNGLRPKLFKTGGSVGGKNYAHIFQTWQDADVITLYKQKGDPTDPGNFRGIFLLDVAGKVLTSVIGKRLKVLIEETVSDS